MVKTLMLKDIKLLGPLINIALIFLVGSFATDMFISVNDYVRIWSLIILITFVIGLVHMSLNRRGGNDNKDIILNCLPIDKKIIISSRYTTILIYILISTFIAMISFDFSKGRVSYLILYKMNEISPPTLSEGLWVIGINLLIYSIYLPIDYYLKGKIDRNSDLPLFFIGILILVARLSMTSNNGIYKYMNNIDYGKLPISLIIISILAYLISLFISIKIYRTKEF